MTTPASPNPISLSDVQTEFGGSNPINITEYYGNGSLVPTDLGVPSSGTISLSNLRGLTNYTSKQISQTGITASSGTVVGSGWTPNLNGYGPYPSRTLDGLTWTATIPITSLTIYQYAYLDYGFNIFIGINGNWNTTAICAITHGPGGQGYASGTSTVSYSIAVGDVVTFAFSEGPYWQQILSDGTVTVTFNK